MPHVQCIIVYNNYYILVLRFIFDVCNNNCVVFIIIIMINFIMEMTEQEQVQEMAVSYALRKVLQAECKSILKR